MNSLVLPNAAQVSLGFWCKSKTKSSVSFSFTQRAELNCEIIRGKAFAQHKVICQGQDCDWVARQSREASGAFCHHLEANNTSGFKENAADEKYKRKSVWLDSFPRIRLLRKHGVTGTLFIVVLTSFSVPVYGPHPLWGSWEIMLSREIMLW